MKLHILHLSDIHFIDRTNYSDDNVDAIVSTLQPFASGMSHLLIIVSGDLAFSGKKNECIVVRKFLDSLKNKINKRYWVRDIQYAIVPGNHDVDYDIGMMDRRKLEEIDKDNSYEELIDSELIKQKQFSVLAKRFDCFSNGGLLHQKRISYDGRSVQLNLINTSVFSAKLDEDQGYHYLPLNDIEKLTNQGDSDYVITVMHHPHHFFNYRCKKKLEEALYTRSDLIFVGHEHYEAAQKVVDGEASVNIFAGGQLCNKGDWSNSEIHVAVLDLDTRHFQTKKYVLNQKVNIYEENDDIEIELSKNRYNQLGLVVKRDFIKEQELDRYAITKSNQDYFVFPLLVEEYINDDKGIFANEINSMDSFMKTLNAEGKIIINGQSDSGKSMLAQAIFKELAKNKVVIFIKGQRVTDNYERTIRDSFEDTYTSNRTSYESFKQLGPDNLAIVIDDVDCIEPHRQLGFIEYVEKRFGTIVETCQFDVDMDVNIKDRLRRRASTRNFTYYRIEPFYSDKRKQLVGNLVHIIINGDKETEERIRGILCDSLTKQKYLYSLNPEFIVQFTQYYCKNIGEAMQNDGSVFSKVFEANLTNLISPFAHKITVEKIFIILDKIAYFIYENGTSAYPITIAQMDEIIQEYNTVYGDRINTSELLKTLLNAKVIKPIDGRYLFYDRNYLAYFTAREIRRKGLEDQDYTQFNRVMDNSFMPINADILLFVTYITDNLNIIRMVMERAIESVNKWNEFDLENCDIAFLTKPTDEVIKPVEDADREEEEKRKAEQERKEVKSRIVVNDSTIFEGADKELDLLDELIRSISLMVIVSRLLPSFEHMMKKPEKDKCVELIYQMPHRIFEAWAKEVDGLTNELVRDIKAYNEWEYRKEKPNYKPINDSDALHLLKTEASLMLLELMNTAIMNATRNNSNDYLEAFPYCEKLTYRIEHLIGLRHRDKVKDFKNEAFTLIDSKEPLARNLVRWVTRNYIVNSKNIKGPDIQSLNDKVLRNKVSSGRLIVEKTRNEKKHGG